MNLFAMIDQSGAAMQAERMRAEVVAANMANAETARTEAGTPYRRQHVVFAAGGGDPEDQFANQFGGQFPSQFADVFTGQRGRTLSTASPPSLLPAMLPGTIPGSAAAPGVRIAAVIEDTAPPLQRYDPSHPDADAQSYVSYPDINPLTEMVDLMGATRAYGLNASADCRWGLRFRFRCASSGCATFSLSPAER
jgi:flagellar basal-body rod protein FlgC